MTLEREIRSAAEFYPPRAVTERVDEIKWRDIIKNWTPLDRSDILSRKHKFLKALIATIREDPIKEGAGQEATHCPLKQDGTDSVEGKEAKKNVEDRHHMTDTTN